MVSKKGGGRRGAPCGDEIERGVEFSVGFLCEVRLAWCKIKPLRHGMGDLKGGEEIGRGEREDGRGKGMDVGRGKCMRDWEESLPDI